MTHIITYIQKQPSRGVLKKRYSENLQQSYMRTPMLKWLYNFIEITLRHGSSPVICSIFSEHVFLTTPLEGCFLISQNMEQRYQQLILLIRKQRLTLIAQSKIDVLSDQSQDFILNDFRNFESISLKKPM